MPTGKYAALILAAGLSSRMNKGFKPLLPVPFVDGRRNSLESLAQVYSEAGVQRIFVVGGRHRGADVAAEAKRLGLAYAQNPHAERGMFSSVCVGINALGPLVEACFVHPADIPLVRQCTIYALLAGTEKHPGDILIPVFKEEEGHPPLLPAAHFSAILAWGGENGLHGAVHTLPRRQIPVADKNILLDMDTDDDFFKVCGRASRRHVLEPEEAEELLRCLAVGERGMAHAKTVGIIAAAFTQACNAAGHALDPLLAEAGGLLHDMCKGKAQHELAAGVTLRAMGLPDMARLVEDHKDCVLENNVPITEKNLIYLADKYVYGDRLVSLQERFGRKLELFSEDAGASQAILGRLKRAEAMESRLRREIGAIPFELARDALKELREMMR